MRHLLRKTIFPLMLIFMFFLNACVASPETTDALPSSVPQASPVPETSPAPTPVSTPEPTPVPTPAPTPEPEPSPVADLPEASPFINTELYILMYHDFVTDEAECNEWKTTADGFRADLQWLTDNGYSFVLPSDLVAEKALPEKAVMITMDDGYASNYHLAYPILQEFNAKAVISLIVAYQVKDGPGALNWDMCREMIDSGLVEIGSHTYLSHDHNAEYGTYGIQRRPGEPEGDYELRILSDIQCSIDEIEANLGQKVLLFAYPFGKTEPLAAEFVRSHFPISVTTAAAPADLSAGLHDLPRFNINSVKHPDLYLK